MILWRISNHAELEGRGGLYAPGRWHNQGRPVVYLSESPAAALIEILVHLEVREGRFPPCYQLLKFQVPDTVSHDRIALAQLAPGWTEDLRTSRGLGDRWLKSGRSALLEVPSVILPETVNWILHPLHPESREIQLEWKRQFPYDRHLFKPRI
jgi:RES domain-containing protein